MTASRKIGARDLKHHFALALGPYDSEEAVGTLPAQLDLLRAFRDLARPDVALIYRVETVPEEEGDLGAHFTTRCVGPRGSLTEDEAASLHDQFSVAFLPAWGLQHFAASVPAPVSPRAKWRAFLQPVEEVDELPIKPDWSPIIDLLRRRERAIAVDLVCRAVPLGAGGAAEADTGRRRPANGHSPAFFPVVDKNERAAAQFFAAIDAVPDDRHPRAQLALSLVVHNESPIDSALAAAIGRLVLGVGVESRPMRRYNPCETVRPGPWILVRPETALRAFHPPYGHIAGRGLSGSRSTRIPVRFRLPELQGSSLGEARRQGARFDTDVPVVLSSEDRRRHMYVVGKTGSGKTNVLKNVVREDIRGGAGVAVIDAHGDLIDYVLQHVGERLDDVVFLDFGRRSHVPLINPLNLDVNTQRDRDLAVEELLDIIIRRSFNEFTGPVFEDTVHMFLSSIASEPMKKFGPPSIAAGVDLFRHAAGRKWIAEALQSANPLLAQQWETFNSMLPHTVSEHVRWVLSKFTEFAPEGDLYAMTSGPETSLSIKRVFDERLILLVKLPEAVLGARAASFIGSLIFSRLHRAALASSPAQRQQPFFLHVDEFQKFVAADVEGLIAEARKFNLALTLAHQNLRQLDAFSRYEGTASARLREAIFSNVGTMISMRTSGADVDVFAEEFGVHSREFRRIGQYEALARCVIDGVEREPFTLHAVRAEDVVGDARVPGLVRRKMIADGYWRPRTRLATTTDRMVQRTRSEWEKPAKTRRRSMPATPTATKPSAFLDEWLARRKLEQKRSAPRNDDESATADHSVSASARNRSARKVDKPQRKVPS